MTSVLGYLGLHVLKREVIFIDIAVAQVSAWGAIAAHMIFHVHADSPRASASSSSLFRRSPMVMTELPAKA